MVTRVPAEHTVLKRARDMCGLTVEAAAHLLGCKPDLLRKIERGEQMPSASMFRNMASRYGFPEATLLAEALPDIPETPRDHRTFEGLPPRLTYRTLLAIRDVQMRQETIMELAEIDDSIRPPSLPRYTTNQLIEDIAFEERKRFAVSVSDQLKISADKLWMTYRMRIEALGINVYMEDFPLKDCRGICLFTGDFPAIILSTEEERASWKLFSLLHEYAHVLVRVPAISDQKSKTSDPVESFCNKFAAAFLMPDTIISSVLRVSRDTPREFKIQDLDEAARSIGTSISSLALRLEELEYAPPGYYKRVKATLKPPTPRKKKDVGPIPRQYVVLNQLGHRFTGDVLQSVGNGVVTTLEASRMLQTNPALLPVLDNTIKGRRREYLNVGVEP
jgi:Zn-dependent peptidase ImmA (M78 family)/DNA-binding XRE family transcriptional regulator